MPDLNSPGGREKALSILGFIVLLIVGVSAFFWPGSWPWHQEVNTWLESIAPVWLAHLPLGSLIAAAGLAAVLLTMAIMSFLQQRFHRRQEDQIAKNIRPAPRLLTVISPLLVGLLAYVIGALYLWHLGHCCDAGIGLDVGRAFIAWVTVFPVASLLLSGMILPWQKKKLLFIWTFSAVSIAVTVFPLLADGTSGFREQLRQQRDIRQETALASISSLSDCRAFTGWQWEECIRIQFHQPRDVADCLHQAAAQKRGDFNELCAVLHDAAQLQRATTIDDCQQLLQSQSWPACIYEFLVDEPAHRACLDMAEEYDGPDLCHLVYAAHVSHDPSWCENIPVENRARCWEAVTNTLNIDLDPVLCDRFPDARYMVNCWLEMADLNRLRTDTLKQICNALPERLKRLEGSDAERAEYQTLCGQGLPAELDQE